jgi:two-component system, LuxR family, response regulator FixJ
MNVPVVIFEPDILQRDLIAIVLKRHGFESTLCEDVDEIFQILEDQKPAVLILSLHLPGKNGLDLMKELSEAGLLNKTKVLVISSLGFPEIVRKSVRAGAAAFLVKPVDLDQLIHRVQQLLD